MHGNASCSRLINSFPQFNATKNNIKVKIPNDINQGCTKCGPHKKFLRHATSFVTIVCNKIRIQNADLPFQTWQPQRRPVKPLQSSSTEAGQDFTLVKCALNCRNFGHPRLNAWKISFIMNDENL